MGFGHEMCSVAKTLGGGKASQSQYGPGLVAGSARATSASTYRPAQGSGEGLPEMCRSPLPQMTLRELDRYDASDAERLQHQVHICPVIEFSPGKSDIPSLGLILQFRPGISMVRLVRL